MAYAPQTWVDNNTQYPVSAARMNFMEAGIDTAHDLAEAAQTNLNTHKTSADHDGRYYTEAESDARFAAIGHLHTGTYAPASHTHDDRYYTESETDTKLATKTSVGLAIALGG